MLYSFNLILYVFVGVLLPVLTELHYLAFLLYIPFCYIVYDIETFLSTS